MLLAAWRGQEQEAADLVETVSREATERGASRLLSLAAYASLVLYNGLGGSAAAHEAGRQAFRTRTHGIRLPHRARAGRVGGQDR